MVRNAFVISDIHLGASTSLLTAIDYNYETETIVKRPLAELLLIKLLEDLKSMLCSDEKVQQCILLGDIFDLSFAPYGLAMQNGRWFFEKLLASGLFEEIVYIPGNHDHHLWQQISEHYYLMSELTNPPLNYPRTLAPDILLENSFLDSLLPPPYRFRVTYPNYKLQVNGRVFYLHHGHYLQKLYMVASNLLSETIETEDIEDLEVLNSPFLEFGWYNIGQAYNIGKQKLIDKLYFMFKNNNTRQLDRLITLFLQKIDQWNGSNRHCNPADSVMDSMIKLIGPFFVKRLFFKHSRLFKKRQHASSIRHERLAGNLDAAVMDYISKYLLSGNNDTYVGTNPCVGPKECSFIFGHTHQPEKDFTCFDNRNIRYHIYNTGGWVLDRFDKDGAFILPQMAPIYIGSDGSVNPLPFTLSHASLIKEQLESSPLFQRIKEMV